MAGYLSKMPAFKVAAARPAHGLRNQRENGGLAHMALKTVNQNAGSAVPTVRNVSLGLAGPGRPRRRGQDHFPRRDQRHPHPTDGMPLRTNGVRAKGLRPGPLRGPGQARTFQGLRQISGSGTQANKALHVTIFLAGRNAKEALKPAHRGRGVENGRMAPEDSRDKLLANGKVKKAYQGLQTTLRAALETRPWTGTNGR